MGDYAAAPVQPIVQGLLTVSGPTAGTPHAPTFNGRGISAVTRVALGTYVLTLDPGLPGNAGEVAPTGAAYPAAFVPGAGLGASSTTKIPAPDVRAALTIRGTTTQAVVPGGSDILNTAVTYITPGADGGFTQIQLIFSGLTAGALPMVAVDPTDIHASGVEMIFWVDADRIN